MRDELDKMDELTKTIAKALDVLLIGNPQKTALGVLLGCVLKGVTDLFFQLKEISISLSIFFFIPLGVVMLNIKNLWGNYSFDPELEKAIHYLEELQKRGDIPESEKRQQWRKMIKLVFDKASASMDRNSGQTVKDKDHTVAQ